MRWILLMVALIGCEKSPEAHADDSPTAKAPATAVSTAPTGIEACDAYVALAAKCAPSHPDLRTEIAQYRKQAAQAKSDAARDAVAVGCEVAREALPAACR